MIGGGVVALVHAMWPRELARADGRRFKVDPDPQPIEPYYFPGPGGVSTADSDSDYCVLILRDWAGKAIRVRITGADLSVDIDTIEDRPIQPPDALERIRRFRLGRIRKISRDNIYFDPEPGE